MRRRTRFVPPVTLAICGVAILAVAVPSGLTVPRSELGEAAAFAPIPRGRDPVTPPPAETVVSPTSTTVGEPDEAGSGTAGAGTGDGTGPGGPGIPPQPPGVPPQIGDGEGLDPREKDCVDGRQTEDPLSPPCVAFFDGDNYGATHTGVTAERITLIVYYDGNVADTCAQGTCLRPTRRFYDLAEPENPDDAAGSGSKHPIVRGLRGWQRYFNDRFQLYGRTARIVVQFGESGSQADEESRRLDALDALSNYVTFAQITQAKTGHEDAYFGAMARQGVLGFGSFVGMPQAVFDARPGYVWGLRPDIQRDVATYTSYVCAQVAGRPSRLNGNTDQVVGADTGADRVYGVIHTSDEAFPYRLELAELAKQRLREDCGIEIAAEATFPRCCFANDTSSTHEYAVQQMAEFQAQGVTTVLWLGGLNGYYGQAADAIGYQPEWVLLGDDVLDNYRAITQANLSGAFDGRAVIVSDVPLRPPLDEQICADAYRSVDPDVAAADLIIICQQYDALFQFFVGVQVAGPRLTPVEIERGFRAIPQVRSDDPAVPACFYPAGDFTCVKDAAALYWDASAVAPGADQPGCWRGIDGGLRYLPGEWPQRAIDATFEGNEPCNGFARRVSNNLVGG